jgi:hypothetical protein
MPDRRRCTILYAAIRVWERDLHISGAEGMRDVGPAECRRYQADPTPRRPGRARGAIAIAEEQYQCDRGLMWTSSTPRSGNLAPLHAGTQIMPPFTVAPFHIDKPG